MKSKRSGGNSTPITLEFDRQLLAAASVPVPEKKELKTDLDDSLMGLFIDGDRVIGSSRSMMTIARDPFASNASKNPKSKMGKMSHQHTHLALTAEIRKSLFRKTNNEKVIVNIYQDYVDWEFSDDEDVGPIRVEAHKEGFYPNYQEIVRGQIEQCKGYMESGKPPFPMVRLGSNYVLMGKTLAALKTGQGREGLIFYGAGSPVQGVVCRYIVGRTISDSIFSLVCALLEPVIPIEREGSVANILPSFMLRKREK